jgi:hypothetical protein
MEQHNPQPASHPEPAPADDTPLRTDIVHNIPMHQAAGAPAHDKDDLDGIMQDVNHQLKKEDIKPDKHHWFGQKKHRTPANFSARRQPHKTRQEKSNLCR